MEPNDYHISINAETTAAKVIDAINNVHDWWGTDVSGESEKPGDRFTIRFGETFVDFEVGEIVPDKKVTWQVLDCNLHWLNDKKEWKGHTIIWEIAEAERIVKVDFTQIGLTPAIECYTDCEKGWNFYIGDSFYNLITTGKGKPDTSSDKRD